MQVAAAKIIARHWFTEGEKVKAIRLLRDGTPLGMVDAKRYLEDHEDRGQAELQKRLVNDFCNEPEFLLQQAIAERKRLDVYIEQLRREIDQNNQEKTDIERL